MDNIVRNNVFAFVNQNNFTAGADFGSGANCLDEFNDTATAFRSAAIASGETDPALNLPTHGRFFFEKNILFNSFRNFGNASWGPNWGVPAKVSLLPRIRYEGVMMVGTGGLWASSFESNLYWSDGGGADPPGSVIAQRGFPCNASNPPGQNWPACSFESWQRSGRDKGGLVTDPMFVDPERRDFRLQAGSPARAMGITDITPSVGPRPHTPMKGDDSDAWRDGRRLSLDQANAARPAWHLRPPTGILSDICGTVWFRGVYHIFYQHHDRPPASQAMEWGHAASTDAVSWRHLQPAILPDRWFDRHGAWDGSVALDPAGVPRLMFSCLPSNGTNMLCTASPKNASDPWLQEWDVAPPVVRRFPPGGNRFDFRDPAALRLAGSTARPWLAAVASSIGTGPSGGAGGQPSRNGSVVVYRSADFQRWDYDGIAWSNGQYGSAVLECPELFPLAESSRWVLRFQPNCRDLYLVGDFSPDRAAQFIGDHRDVRLVDGGLFCASRSFTTPGGRRVIVGAVNCDSSAVYAASGGCGVASAPRTIAPHPGAPGMLAVAPVPELERLRGTTKLVALRSTVVSSGTPTQFSLQPPGAGLSLDAVITVHSYALSPGVRGIGVRVRQHAASEHVEVAVDWLDSSHQADVEFVGEALGFWSLPVGATHDAIPGLCGKACEATADCVGWSVAPGADRCELKHTIPPATPHAGSLSGNIACHYLAVRRTNLGLPTQTPDRILRLDASLTEATAVADWTIRVLVDRSLIEAFAFGRAVSARFYPRAQENASGVSVVALGSQVTVDADIWRMPLVVPQQRRLNLVARKIDAVEHVTPPTTTSLAMGVTVAIGSAHRSVQAGDTIAVVATVAGLPAGGSARLWPFANARQWGAYCTVYHPSTNCTLLLPLPTAGDVPIQVAALAKAPVGPHGPRFPVGATLPPDALAVSNPVSVQVKPRLVRYARTGARTRVMMEWETWFTDSNMAADGFMYLLRQTSFLILSLFRFTDLFSEQVRGCALARQVQLDGRRGIPTADFLDDRDRRHRSARRKIHVVMLSRFVELSIALTLNVSLLYRIGQTTCGETVIGAADRHTRRSW
eukprot:COSAG04_NODE_567_length_12551_cov_8.279553_6_plen_1080_part_00